MQIAHLAKKIRQFLKYFFTPYGIRTYHSLGRGIKLCKCLICGIIHCIYGGTRQSPRLPLRGVGDSSEEVAQKRKQSPKIGQEQGGQ
jgi:hypothetical protein